MKSIFQNGRRHITSSKNEVSRDLVVNVKSKKKQALLVDASSFFISC
jgi:syndetin